MKVSIILRCQGDLWSVQYLPSDQYLISTKQFNNRIAMVLSDPVSEGLLLPTVTSDIHEYFKKVTQIVYVLVISLSMCPKMM